MTIAFKVNRSQLTIWRWLIGIIFIWSSWVLV